jgi:hypothetical protein
MRSLPAHTRPRRTVNARDRATLGALLDQLWDTRMGVSAGPNKRSGWLTRQQRELLAAAMRIVDGTTEGSELPDPWGTAPIWSAQQPQPFSEPQRGWLAHPLWGTYREWLKRQPWWTRALHWMGWG